jgi:antitoxin ChpS
MRPKVGDVFGVDVKVDAIVLHAAKPRYKLADLLAQCDPNAPMPRIEEWDDMRPVGNEVWWRGRHAMSGANWGV